MDPASSIEALENVAASEETRPIVVDSHLDLAFNALSLKRDLLLEIEEIRRREEQMHSYGIPTVSLSELLRGNVKVVFATLWANPCNNQVIDVKPCYSNQEEAHGQALQQIEYYERLEKGDRGVISIIRTKDDLEDALTQSDSRNSVGVVILMEGADPIREPKEVREWFRRGVRIVGPAWKATRYAGGTGAPGPLTQDGRNLLEEMQSLGMILDGSHFSEESFFEALDRFKGEFVVSHANSRVFSPSDRHLSDEMISSVTKREGVIGTVLYNAFLDGSWKKGSGKEEITLAHVVRNLRHVCSVAGDRLHVGIGSDLDGGFGAESTPKEIDTIADIQKLGTALAREGFSTSDVSNVLGQNWIRVLRRALPSK